MKNKIIQKYTLPRFALFGGYLLVVTSFVGAVINIVDEQKFEEQIHAKHQKNIISAYVLVTCMLLAYLYRDIKNGAKTTLNNAVREYIKNLMDSDKDFADFQHLINNPEVLQHIGNFISNSLRINEQKQIADIIAKTEYIVNPLGIGVAYKQIEQIISDHIHVHPEFVPNLYSEITRAEHIYYWHKENWKQK